MKKTEKPKTVKSKKISRNHPPRQDVIRHSRLLLIDILLLQAFISLRIVTINFVARL